MENRFWNNKLEEDVKKFWKDNNIYEKWLLKNIKSDKVFRFLEGPPYTTGSPHLGHAYVKTLKDVLARYKNKKGYFTLIRAGFDMHGLPIEEKVEKELKIKNKLDIERIFGISRFIDECNKFAYGSMLNWYKFYDQLARLVDTDNTYLPITNDYIEGVWKIIKKAHEKNLLYEGYKPIWWCPRCQTSLSKQEVDLGYEDPKYTPSIDESIYVKIRSKENENLYYIIWTTTPWTLLYNMGIMVNPDLDYVLIKVKKTYVNNLEVDDKNKKILNIDIKTEDNYEYWIINKEALERLRERINISYDIIDTFKGSKLEGKEYYHPFYEELKDIVDDLKKKYENSYKIWLSKEYVNNIEGSGLVHAAPGCGPEDYEVAKKYNVEPFNTVNEEGIIENLKEFSGLKAKEDNIKIVYKLLEKKMLVLFEYYKHDYPICWRCGTRLIIRTSQQWFLDIQSLKNSLIEDLKNIYFVPDSAKTAFANVILSAPDWVISRQRYWGIPLPVWKCENNHIYVVGSIKELEKLSGRKLKTLYIVKKIGKYYEDVLNLYFKDYKKIYLESIDENDIDEYFEKLEDKTIIVVDYLDENLINNLSKKYYVVRTYGNKDFELIYVYNFNLHRPYIDDITFKCPVCGKQMKRIKDVLDVWIDSGSATVSTNNYPVDYINESVDQLRGWFYSLAILGKIYFGEIPYRAVYVTGYVTDALGRKMSKSFGNVILPEDIIQKYGVDTMRYFLSTASKPYEEVRVSWEEIKARKQRLDILFNIYNYLIEYSKYYDINPINSNRRELRFEDKYILHLLNKTIKEVEESMDKYYLYEAGKKIENLFLALSRFYIQNTRERIKEDPETVLSIIFEVLYKTVNMFSIISPHISEYIYQGLKERFGLKEESVVLLDWPKYDEKYINYELDKIYEIYEDIVEAGLSLRNKLKIGRRKPLKALFIYPTNKEIEKYLNEIKDLLSNTLNVKNILITDNKNYENFEIGKYAIISYDTQISEEIIEEWILRELRRNLQEIRKKNRLRKGDKCIFYIKSDEYIMNIVIKNKKNLEEETDSIINLEKNFKEKEKYNIEIEGHKIEIYFSI